MRSSSGASPAGARSARRIPRAQAPHARRRRRLPGHDVLHGARAAPAAVRRGPRAVEGGGRHPHGRLPGRRPLRRPPQRRSRVSPRRQANLARGARSHRDHHRALRARRPGVALGPRPARPGNSQLLRVDGGLDVADRCCSGRPARRDHRHGARRRDRGRTLRAGSRRRRVRHRNRARVRGGRRSGARPRRVGRGDPSSPGARASAARGAPPRRSRSNRNRRPLAHSAPGASVRHAHGAGAARPRPARLRFGRDRCRVPRLGCG